MLRVTSTVDDLFLHVFHPIGRQVINKMMHDLDMEQVFANRVYIKSDHTQGFKSLNTEDGTPNLKDARMNVELVHNLNPFATTWETATFNHKAEGRNGPRHAQDKKPVFHDEMIQTTVFEEEVPANLLMNFTLRLDDRVDAESIANKILTTYTNGAKFFVTDLAFNYPFPMTLATLLLDFHKIKGGDASTYLAYLEQMSGERINTNVNRFDIANGPKQIVVKKNLSRVFAQLDYTAEKPEADKANQTTDRYTIEFTLTMQFSRPHMLEMQYPIVMMNQALPGNLLVLPPNAGYTDPAESHPFFNEDAFHEYLRAQYPPQPELVNIPFYDGWTLPPRSALAVMEYKPFLSVVFTLDDIENPNGVTTLDLETDLGVTLRPEIIDVLREQDVKSLWFDGNALNVSVYTNDVPLEPSTELTLVNGTQLTITNRNPYPVYRLVLSEYKGKPNGRFNTFRVAAATIIAKKQ